MKKIFLLFMAAAVFMASSCTDDDPTPSVSFDKAAYALTNGSIDVNLIMSDYSEGLAQSADITFSGTAVKGTDYTVSAETFSFSAGVVKATITISAKDNYDAAKNIILNVTPPTGFVKGDIPVATVALGKKELTTYSFESRETVMSSVANVVLELRDEDDNPVVAEDEIVIPISVDTENSTAVEGVNFEFADNAEVVIPVGQSKGTVVLNLLAKEDGKDLIVLKANPGLGFVAGQNSSVKISIFGAIMDKVVGKWVASSLVTDEASVIANNWLEEGTDLVNFPEFNSEDSFEISQNEGSYILTPSFSSYFKYFFTGVSNVTLGEEYTLHIDMQTTLTIQLMDVDNVNRYLSETQISDLNESTIGIGFSEDGQTLKLFLVDYEPKEWSGPWFDASRPTAINSGSFLEYDFVKAAE